MRQSYLACPPAHRPAAARSVRSDLGAEPRAAGAAARGAGGECRRGRRRADDGDARGNPAPVEGHPNGAREAFLPGVRDHHPAAGTVARGPCGRWHSTGRPGRYTERLAEAGIEPSVGSVCDSYDNALADSINGLYETEMIRRQGPWRSLEPVEFATLDRVEWFNNRRLLEPIGNIPPAEAIRFKPRCSRFAPLQSYVYAAWPTFQTDRGSRAEAFRRTGTAHQGACASNRRPPERRWPGPHRRFLDAGLLKSRSSREPAPRGIEHDSGSP